MHHVLGGDARCGNIPRSPPRRPTGPCPAAGGRGGHRCGCGWGVGGDRVRVGVSGWAGGGGGAPTHARAPKGPTDARPQVAPTALRHRPSQQPHQLGRLFRHALLFLSALHRQLLQMVGEHLQGSGFRVTTRGRGAASIRQAGAACGRGGLCTALQPVRLLRFAGSATPPQAPSHSNDQPIAAHQGPPLTHTPPSPAGTAHTPPAG